LSQPWIRSRLDILTFYRSDRAAFGTTPPGSSFVTFETGAAIDITEKVRSELAASNGSQ
jgi:hypothetical protein